MTRWRWGGTRGCGLAGWVSAPPRVNPGPAGEGLMPEWLSDLLGRLIGLIAIVGLVAPFPAGVLIGWVVWHNNLAALGSGSALYLLAMLGLVLAPSKSHGPDYSALGRRFRAKLARRERGPLLDWRSVSGAIRDFAGDAVLTPVLAVLFICLISFGPLAIGWLAGGKLFGQPMAGGIAACTAVGLSALLLHPKGRPVLLLAGASLIFSVPIVYGLVLAGRLALLPLNLTHLTLRAYLVPGLLRTVAACGIAILATLKNISEKAADLKDRKENPGGSLPERFLLSLPFKIPAAFLLASLVGLPARPLALVITGALAGVVATSSNLVYNALIDHAPVGEGLLRMIFTEFAFMICIVVGAAYAVMKGIPDGLAVLGRGLLLTMELFLPACLTCLAAYLLAAWASSARARRGQPGAAG